MIFLNVIFLASLTSVMGEILGNDNLQLSKNTSVILGTQTAFICSLPPLDQQIIQCQIETPSGNIWTVSEQNVNDENGNPVPGYTGVVNEDAARHCGLSVEAVSKEDLGDWSCILTRTGGATDVVRGIVNLRTEEELTDLRLPDNVIPIHYNLSVVIILEDRDVTDGNVIIDALIKGQEGMFTVNFNRMSFREKSVRINSGGDNLIIMEHIYDFERYTYTVKYEVPSNLPAEYPVTVSIGFDGILHQIPLGFFKDSYKERETGNQVNLVATQFEATSARRAFPCLDEPSLKATFDIQIGRHYTLRSMSNMPLKSTGAPVNEYPNYVWDQFETTETMSTYLLAVSVNDYATVESDPRPNGVQFLTHARNDAIDGGLASYAKDIGADLLQYYEDTFSPAFPLAKEAQIAVPIFGSSAMENWGLVIYGERALLIDASQTSDLNRYLVVYVNAHELAHQWFGDLVTMEWWQHIWLNEGYASWVTYLGADAVEPEMVPWDRFYIDETVPVFIRDAYPDAVAMLEPIDNGAKTNFGDITYKKGAAMNRMMEYFLTRDTFIRGLKEYLVANQFGNADTDDLWSYLTKAGHEDTTLNPLLDIKTIMDPWLKQNNYPVLSVTRNYQSGEVTLKQDRFLLEEDPAGEDRQWFIPITFVKVGIDDFESNSKANFFLEPNSIFTLNINDVSTPIVFNVMATGYYRVNYDSENWDLLIGFLKNENISAIEQTNRAQLLNDAFAFAEAGLEAYDLPLRLAQYLPRETAYTPLAAADFILKRLQGMMNIPQAAQDLKDFIKELFFNQYSNVGGIQANEANTFTENILQELAVSVSCRNNMDKCVQDSLDVFHQWMEMPNPDEMNPVNRQVRETVYCSAIRNGSLAEFTFLTARELNAWVAQEKNAILNGLACVVDENLLQGLLERASANINSDPARFYEMFKAVSSRSELGLKTATNWIFSSPDIVSRLYLKSIFNIIKEGFEEYGRSLDDLEILEKLSDLLKTNIITGDREDIMAAKFALAKAKKTIERKWSWSQKYERTISDWLSKRKI